MKKKNSETKTSEKSETTATPVAKPERMVLKQTQEIDTDIPNFLDAAIDKYGAKRLVLAIGHIALWKGLEKSCFPSNLLATKKDEDVARDATAILYLREHWDEASKKGMKIFERKQKEYHERKEKNELQESR